MCVLYVHVVQGTYAEKSKGKLTLMGKENFIHIWQPHNGSKFRINQTLRISS